MMKGFETLVKIALKIAIPFSFILIASGIALLFYEIWVGIITIALSIFFLFASIFSRRWYNRDKESYLNFLVSRIAWRDFALLLFFSLFFLFPALISFYSGDEETAALFGALFMIFLFLAWLIRWQNKGLGY